MEQDGLSDEAILAPQRQSGAPKTLAKPRRNPMGLTRLGLGRQKHEHFHGIVSP